MIPLPELHKRYKTEHPHYFDTLARFDPSDQKLESLKRKALLPFFETLEEKMIVYKEMMVAFAVLFEVEVDRYGFKAHVWRLNPIHVPSYAKPLANRKHWTIGCKWKEIRLLRDRINCMPYGWTFWPEERVVGKIEEKYVREGPESAYLALSKTITN